jgi:hypothetical protein
VDIRPIWTLGEQRTDATFYWTIAAPTIGVLPMSTVSGTRMRVALGYERERDGAENMTSGQKVAQRVATRVRTPRHDDGTAIAHR